MPARAPGDDTGPPAQLGLFGAVPPKPSARAKCRRVGCGKLAKDHPHAACVGFLGADEVARPGRKSSPVTDRNRAYCDAYAAGIHDADPGAWSLVGTVVAAAGVCGVAASQHAPGVIGDALIAWLRSSAAEFRRATARDPQFSGAWQPYAWAKWLNTRGKANGKQSMLQSDPPGGLRVHSVSLADLVAPNSV